LQTTVYTVSSFPYEKPRALMVYTKIVCSMNYVDYLMMSWGHSI